MLTPQRRAQMDAALGKTSTLTPQKRAQMDAVLGRKKTIGGFVGKFAGNVVKSGAKLVGDVFGAAVNAFNPDLEKNTVANIAKLSTGIVQKLDPTEGNKIAARVPGIGLVQKYAGDQEQVANNAIDFYKQRYSPQNIGNTIYNDPIGVAADVATIASGVGGALRGGGAVASKLGSVSNAGKLTRAGQTMSKIGQTIDPIMIAGRGVGKVTGAIGSKTKPFLLNRSNKMVTAGLGNPATQAKLEKITGRTVPQFIDEYNLYDRSPQTLDDVTKSIGEAFDTRATATNKSLRTGEIIKAFDDEIAKLSQGTGGVIADATAQKIAELQRRRQMFLDSIVQAQSSPIELPMSQVTDFRRRVIDPDVPKSEYGLNPKDAGKAGGVKSARDIFKLESQKIDPELKKLGKDYQMAKGLQPIFDASAARASNRQLLNFTKLGSAGLGGFFGGIPGAITGYASERIVNSPQFIKFGSKALKKLAGTNPQSRSASKLSKTQKLTQPQLVRLQSLLNPTATNAIYQVGRAGRMTNQGMPEIPQELQAYLPYVPQEQYIPKSDLLDKIAEKQGLNVEEMRKKRLNFQRK